MSIKSRMYDSAQTPACDRNAASPHYVRKQTEPMPSAVQTAPMTPDAASPHNHLLARLGASDGHRLLKLCDTVQLRPTEVLCESGAPMPNAYFPTQGFISMLSRIEGHRGVEVCMVGNEGMLGAPIVLGVAGAPCQALVQGAGESLRIDSRSLRDEMNRSPLLVQLLQRYIYVQMAQTAISAGCLRFHPLGARLARWLLMAQDRADADRFRVTQDFLAYMLGVRRAGVSAVAAAFQQRGLIHYRRGNFTVLDRCGLQAMACSCYAAGKRFHADVMVERC